MSTSPHRATPSQQHPTTRANACLSFRRSSEPFVHLRDAIQERNHRARGGASSITSAPRHRAGRCDALQGASRRRWNDAASINLIHLEDGRVIHVHFRMNGDWVIGSSSDPLPRFARAVFPFPRRNARRARGLACAVNARHSSRGRLAAARARAGAERSRSHSGNVFARRSSAVAFRSRSLCSIKVSSPAWETSTLSEALWRAKIDPRASAASLELPVIRRLLAAIRAVIARATGGRYTSTEGARLDVYDREGEPCRRCRTTIARIIQSGRSTYFCPHCQRAASVSVERLDQRALEIAGLGNRRESRGDRAAGRAARGVARSAAGVGSGGAEHVEEKRNR